MNEQLPESDLDRWADWLLRGRDAQLSEPERHHRMQELNRLRDRLLAGARLEPHDHVLDVGAGTGLLALEAASRAGPDGLAVALDVSWDGLHQCRRQAAAATPPLRLRCVGGDVTQLPFPDGSFDVVLTRSVLIYVFDKQAAVNEMFRVLRPGGRVSAFEPVNAAARLLGLDDEVPAEIREDHQRVLDAFQQRSPHWQSMMGFDERDLIRWFIAAGFEAAHLSYEMHATLVPKSTEEALRSLDMRGNPTGPTLREAAVAALGANADRYLDIYVDMHGQPRTSIEAHAFLTATRYTDLR